MSLITLLLLGSTLSTAPVPMPASLASICATGAAASAVVQNAGDEELRALYQAGQSFDEFLGEAERRRELWDANWATSATSVSDEMVARAEAVGGEWHILVSAIDGCSDSVSTIPFIARLAERASNVQIRIVTPVQRGAEMMAAHPTPDGRSATPTVLLLDADFDRVGCLVERPEWLRDHILENPDGLDRGGIFEMKMAWYEENAGVDTVEETIGMLETAARGGMQCAPAGASMG